MKNEIEQFFKNEKVYMETCILDIHIHIHIQLSHIQE